MSQHLPTRCEMERDIGRRLTRAETEVLIRRNTVAKYLAGNRP